MSLKVFLVDDHPFTRAGVRAILGSDKTIEIVGEAEDGKDAIKKVSKQQPDIVVMDITMPNLSGIEATQKILNSSPNIKVIALSMHSGEHFVKEMLDVGAVGYLLKDEATEELLRAIDKVSKGEIYLSSAVTRAALDKNEKEEKIKEVIILQTKLQRPPVMDDYVVRTEIIDTLEKNITKPLSVISAGAGYGKSVTVSQWIEQSDALYSWISLDDEHNDLRVFFLYLLAAIEKVFPGLLEETSNHLAAVHLPSLHDLSFTLINELSHIDHDFILVLDNYHVIREKEIHQLIDEWLLFPPKNVHLSILTRLDPPLRINPLRIKNRMTEVRMEDLSFTEQEIADLFNNRLKINLNDQTLKLLYKKTEGWIIALRLASMIMKGEDDADQLLISKGESWESISEYLISEVLSKQTENIQIQLIESSILNRFCSDLISEITQTEDTDEQRNVVEKDLIQWLHKANIFIIQLDTVSKWFRYHKLFQELLQTQLRKRRTVTQINEIHIRASRWFEENDFISEAIVHAIKARDIDRAIRMIFENWEVAFERDIWNTVEEWLAFLPEQAIVQSTPLLIARMWIAMKRQRVEAVREIIELIEQPGNDLNDKETGYLACARCMVSCFMGSAVQAIDYAEQALQLIPIKNISFRADTKGWWTLAMQVSGQGKLAIQAAEEDLKNLDPPGEPVQLVRRTMHPNFVHITHADLPALKRSIETFFKIPGISPYMMGFGAYFRASICWWSYDLENSVDNFEYSIKHQSQSASRQGIDSYIGQALAFQELNKPKNATQTLNHGIQYAGQGNDPVSGSVIASGQARLNLMKGDFPAAIEWLDTTKSSSLDPSMLWWVEVPAITRCRVLIAKGTPKSLLEALNLLKEYRIYSESVFNNLRTIEIVLLQAQANLKSGHESDAINTLKYALELAAEGEWVRPFVEAGDEVSDLLIQLKEQSVRPEFIKQILAKAEQKKRIPSIASTQEAYNMKMGQADGKLLFTIRELEVLKYVAEGLRNKEIATKLFISDDAIKKHLYKMFQKLDVNNRISLVTKAKKMGYLEGPDILSV